MKKVFIVILPLAFLLMSMLPEEVCDSALFKKGTTITMTNYDSKGNAVSTGTSTIQSVIQSGTSTSADMHVVTVDNKGKEQGQADIKMRCENGKYYMDMKNFVASSAGKMGKDITLDFEGTDMEYPSVFDLNSSLPDAMVKMTAKSNGTTVATTIAKMYNRKVIAKESHTTPAGTFECWKISYDIDVDIAFSMGKIPVKPYQNIEWYSSQVGIVRTESYKEEKMESYSELTKIVKP